MQDKRNTGNKYLIITSGHPCGCSTTKKIIIHSSSGDPDAAEESSAPQERLRRPFGAGKVPSAPQKRLRRPFVNVLNKIAEAPSALSQLDFCPKSIKNHWFFVGAFCNAICRPISKPISNAIPKPISNAKNTFFLTKFDQK